MAQKLGAGQQTSPGQIEGKHIQQIVGFVGQLRDEARPSEELRKFLSMIPSSSLQQYASECLSTKFESSGLVLQDIVNEVGARLGFEILSGRYRGSTAHLGFDGLWKAPEGHALVLEVKTTDVYRIPLDTVAEYRRALLKQGSISEGTSSILIVVGREDTGDLEAQIRGSRHSWDIRLISVDALLRLMRLKEETDDPSTHRRIRGILAPLEFTKIDGVIDFIFAATQDVEGSADSEKQVKSIETGDAQRPTAVGFHEACATKIQAELRKPLVRRSRTLFATPDDELRVIVAVSRVHDEATTPNYWFAIHPHQRERLASAGEAFVAFGCGSKDQILLVPFATFDRLLDGLWTTTRSEAQFYWHVVIYHEDGKFVLRRKKGFDRVDLTAYLL